MLHEIVSHANLPDAPASAYDEGKHRIRSCADAESKNKKQEKRVPNLKSSMKDMRVSERRRQRNRPIISATRTYVRRARTAIEAGDTSNAATAVGDAISALDRAASKGVIHRNNAARRKSRLMAKYNALGK